MKYVLDFFIFLLLGYSLWLSYDSQELIGNIRARIPTGEVKPPVIYLIAEVKDSKKVCKKDIKWCYWSGKQLECSADEKNLPNDVSHLKICSQ